MATIIKVVVVLLSALLFRIHAAQYFAYEYEISKCRDEHDLSKIIPVHEILIEILAAYKFDPEVRIAFEHIASLEFRTKIDRLELQEDYLAFIDFCQWNNLKITGASDFVEIALLAISQPTMVSFPSVNPNEITGGVHGLVMRIFGKYISMEDIRHCIQARSECDPKYREKINSFRSKEFQKLLENLRSTEEYREIIKDLKGYKIYFEDYLNTVLDCFEIPH